MNSIFDKLVKSKIEKFIYDYKNLSRQIFLDEKGNLIHSGEFGVYREKIVKDLIEPFLPSRLAVGSGFIITSNDRISTQCDLIIYDKGNTPLIESDEQRFFPIETVVGVIEVKSKLTKATLKEALIKLSNIKKLRENVDSGIYLFKDYKGGKKIDSKLNVRDQIATFLICESIDMDLEKEINTFFADTYRDIDKSLYHNMLLSIDDGCFLYRANDKKPMYHSYFDYTQERFPNLVIFPSESGYAQEHILLFINYFFMIISSISVMYLEITNYLGASREKSYLIEEIKSSKSSI